MSNHTLFISDLHLDPSLPEMTQLFEQFMQQQAPKADAVYVLGDLFEAWLGDDDLNNFSQHIIAQFRQASDQGLPIYIMRGNRDFLLGKRFCDAAGATLINDPTEIKLYQQPVILLHGDSLCTHDQKHQKFRRKVHSPNYQKNIMRLPLWLRRLLAKVMRSYSKSRNKQLSVEIMDVNKQEVAAVMQKHAVQLMIHGHTHRPAIHDLTANASPAQRIVLAAWHQQGNALRFNDDGSFELIYFN